jgi:hypothetical protein
VQLGLNRGCRRPQFLVDWAKGPQLQCEVPHRGGHDVFKRGGEMTHRPVRLTAACVAILFTLLASAVAVAADFTWNSGAGGSFSDPAKWSPAGGPPGPNDTATFSDPAAPSYTVTVSGATHASAVHVVGDSLTLDLSGGTFTLDAAAPASLLLQPTGPVRANLTVSNGTLSIPNGGIQSADPSFEPTLRNTLTITGNASVSAASFSHPGVTEVLGRLSVPGFTIDPNGFVHVQQGGTLTTIAPLPGGTNAYGDVILNGGATNTSLYAQSGGKIIVGGNLIAGGGDNPPNPNVIDYASVFDAGSLLQIGDPATGRQSDFTIGHSARAVSYMSSNSQTVVTRDMYVGRLPNSSGLAIIRASVDVSRDVHIGADPAVPVPAGFAPAVGHVQSEDDAVITVGRTLHVHPGGSLTHGSVNSVNPRRPTLTVAAGIQNAGNVAGDGIINGDFANSGNLTPLADAHGHLHINGRFVQTRSGVLHERFDEAAPVERFSVTGPTVDLGGSIVLTIIGADHVRVDDRFLVLRTTAPINYSATIRSTEAFTYAPLFEPGTGLYAVVTSVPEPGVAVLAFIALLGFGRRR